MTSFFSSSFFLNCLSFHSLKTNYCCCRKRTTFRKRIRMLFCLSSFVFLSATFCAHSKVFPTPLVGSLPHCRLTSLRKKIFLLDCGAFQVCFFCSHHRELDAAQDPPRTSSLGLPERDSWPLGSCLGGRDILSVPCIQTSSGPSKDISGTVRCLACPACCLCDETFYLDELLFFIDYKLFIKIQLNKSLLGLLFHIKRSSCLLCLSYSSSIASEFSRALGIASSRVGPRGSSSNT